MRARIPSEYGTRRCASAEREPVPSPVMCERGARASRSLALCERGARASTVPGDVRARSASKYGPRLYASAEPEPVRSLALCERGARTSTVPGGMRARSASEYRPRQCASAEREPVQSPAMCERERLLEFDYHRFHLFSFFKKIVSTRVRSPAWSTRERGRGRRSRPCPRVVILFYSRTNNQRGF